MAEQFGVERVFGYKTPLLTCKRVGDLIEQEFGIRYHPGHVGKIVRAWTGARSGRGTGARTQRRAIREWKQKTWPAAKKRPKKWPPDRFPRRKWVNAKAASLPDVGAAGPTPILFHYFNWKNLSLIAGLSRWNLYFEMLGEIIKSPHVAVFVEKLLRVIPGKLPTVWRPPEQVRQELHPRPGRRIAIQRLPAYAPELNPVEYVSVHLKQHEPPMSGQRPLEPR
jgi:hypothetical protein